MGEVMKGDLVTEKEHLRCSYQELLMTLQHTRRPIILERSSSGFATGMALRRPSSSRAYQAQLISNVIPVLNSISDLPRLMS